jgi:YbgC/YbaW family acyl-CoA thioester hydrolase
MARVKINLPEQLLFSCTIPIRITDINYGGHVGNDAVLSIIHEARLQFLKSLGYTEMEFAEVGLIMADVAIEFKKELFYGDTVIVSVATGEISKVSIDLFYKLEKESLKQDGNEKTLIATAKTGMICYDYKKKKIVTVPEEAKRKLRYQ